MPADDTVIQGVLGRVASTPEGQENYMYMYILFTVHCTYCILYILYIVYCVLYILYMYIVYCVLYTVHTGHCSLYTVHCRIG